MRDRLARINVANYRSVKTADETGVYGLELIKRDKSVYAVELHGIRIESDYGLRVLVREPFERVERHRVTATVEGFDPKVMHFETKHSADRCATDYENKGATVTNEAVTCLLGEAGEIVGEVTNDSAAAFPDNVPF